MTLRLLSLWVMFMCFMGHADATPCRIAVVVGISKYSIQDGEETPNLQFPALTAAEVAGSLALASWKVLPHLSSGDDDGSAEKMANLADSFGLRVRAAGLDHIQESLSSLSVGCAGQPADEVLFYFAGHGKLGRNSMLLQMLPDPRGNRYLDVGELAKRVRKAAPKAQFTAILDACQTPGGLARADRLYFPLQNPFLPAPRPTEAFLSSSSPLMPVADVDAYANELFAQLQEGSAADSDCNGTVSLVEAHLYVGLLQRHYDLSSRIGRQRRTSGVESKEDCVPYAYLVYSPSSEGAAAFQLQVSPQEPAWEGVPGRSIPWKIQALHRASYELHFLANDHNFPVLRIHPRPGEVVDANRILEQNFQERRARVHLSLVTGTFSLPSPAFQDVAVKAIDLFSGGQLRYYPYHANLRFGRPSVGVRVLQGWGLEQGQLYTAGWIGPELGWWLRLSPWPGASTPWCWTRPELQIGVVGTAELAHGYSPELVRYGFLSETSRLGLGMNLLFSVGPAAIEVGVAPLTRVIWNGVPNTTKAFSTMPIYLSFGGRL